jgi:hypothetical protein
MPDNTLSTLQQIQTKVRRLTRSMSESQLSTSDLNDYINTAVLYDFPEHLRLFNQHQTFTFYTQPYVDTYTSSDTVGDVLYNFKNKYISVNPPVFVAGFQAMYSQSRDQFFGIYPFLNSIASIGVTGDGITNTFTGVVNTQQAQVPINATQNIVLLKNNVLFSSIDVNDFGLTLIDLPLTTDNALGNLYVPGAIVLPSDTVQDVTNYINYLTGEFVITFSAAPGVGATIDSQTVQVQPSRPQAMLYYNDTFTLRPVPDQAYAVNMEVYVRPDELLANNQSLELAQWWQYISYLASKKIFEDRMDLESVQQILPELKKQELLVLRRTIVQHTNQRTATVYSEQTGAAGAYGPGLFSGGGNF